ncbi:MAG TPA: nitrate reductase cytochrome c-type subunit [Anaeromyxobacteraceae bacterium]|nr:nitrate reductase cytochrome c-type subunit [Anaeromyxobacteraceae bacterium]
MPRTSVGPGLALALLAACAGSRATPPPPPPAPVPDTALGLDKGSVFDAHAPPTVKAEDGAPGEKPVLPRPYPLAPPRVPHAIADFLPITASQNSCADCHEVKEKVAGQPTPIPASHYTDLRRAATAPGPKLAGARWVCTSCHVPTSDAKPLVGNAFTAR